MSLLRRPWGNSLTDQTIQSGKFSMSVESRNMDTFNQVLANLRSRKTFIRLLDSDQANQIDLGDLGDLIAANARHFRAQGINPGVSVAISLKTDVEHIVSFLALVALGAIPVSIKPARTMTPSYIEETSRLCDLYAINHCYHTMPLTSRIRPICWQAKPFNQNRSAIIETQPDDVAFVQFSSGSTGNPKPIPVTHRNLMANLLTILCVEARKAEETAFNFLPLSHDMGLIGGLLSNFILQNSLLLTGPSQFLRHPIDLLKIGQQYNIGGLAMPDFSLRHLGRMLELTSTDHVPTNLFAGIRFIYCGAERIRFETIDRFITAALPLGLNPQSLFLCYGLAEATLLVAGGHFDSMQTSFDHRAIGQPLACVGRALGNLEIRIGEPEQGNGDVSRADEREGPIHLRGPSVFPGYWKERPLPKDGWFRTGDIGRVRRGNLYISGREKELLIVNGENIFPNDIEHSIASSFDVRDCLAMFDDEQLYILIVPNFATPVRSQAISALICATFGISPRAILTASAKDILRTTSGKPKRKETLVAARQRGLFEPPASLDFAG